MDQPLPSLEFLRRLILAPVEGDLRPEVHLAQLTAATGSLAAGFYGPFPGKPLLDQRFPPEEASAALPWRTRPDVVDAASPQIGTKVVQDQTGRFYRLADQAQPDGTWVLWLRHEEQSWRREDEAILVLLLQHLTNWVSSNRTACIGQAPVEPARLYQRYLDASRIASRTAHDFDNLLTGILGFGELTLQQLPQAAPARRYMTELLKAAERGSETTHRLRAFSRSSEISPGPSAPIPLLQAEETRWRKMLPANTRLAISLPPQVPLVAVGEGPLAQVLRALGDNAIEAVAAGGQATMSVATADLDWKQCLRLVGNCRPGPYVTVCFRDNGAGIAPEVHKRLLVEPFFSTKPGHQGLGLPTAFRILYAHAGGMSIQPGLEGGTEVEVYLPQEPPTGASRTAPPI